MTTTWPAAPGVSTWRELDDVLDTVDTVLRRVARPGGLHQVRWEPSGQTRVAFERLDGDAVVLEADGSDLRFRRLVEDPALPGLVELLDGTLVGERLAGLLPHPVHHCAVTVVSYRPGSRCAVRYDVAGEEGNRSVLFAKVLAHGLEVSLETHRALAGTLGSGVPPLVAVWPDLGALVTQSAAGRSASAVLADPRTSPRSRQDLARALGSLLAAVHRTAPGPAAGRVLHTPDGESRELEGYLEAAWRGDAEAAVSLGWLVRELDALTPPAGRHVLSHGSYRAGQVVVDGTSINGTDGDGTNGHRIGLTLLDLDSAALAPPERDLGNAMAYLDWSFLRRPQEGSEHLSSAVVEGYLDHGGLVVPEALAWWHAASMAKIAGRRYRALDVGHWRAVPSLINAAHDVLTRACGLPGPGAVSHLRPGSVAQVADGASMSRILAEVLEHRAAGDGLPVTVSEPATLRIAAGRRVVERYRLTGTSADDGEVILKAYAEPHRAAIAHENLGTWATLTDPAIRVGTPSPIGHLATRGIVLSRAVSGRPLTQLPQDEAADVAARCARWLREVHGSGAPHSRMLDLEQEVANVAVWADQIGRGDDHLSAGARELAERLAAVAADLPTVTGVIHKDLHLDHVIVDASGWAWIIDLDEARMGDPAFDVAHLRAYADETAAQWVGEVFASAYGPLEGPAAELRLAYFRAYTLLKITKQQVRDRRADDWAERGAERLERGLACLSE